MTYREKLRHLPEVIRRLRRHAGFTSVNAAALAIREKTGEPFSRPTLSKWENGRLTPSLEVLVTFLEGLGYDLKAFQDELDRVALDRVAGDDVEARKRSVAAKPAVATRRATRKPSVPARRSGAGWMVWED